MLKNRVKKWLKKLFAEDISNIAEEMDKAYKRIKDLEDVVFALKENVKVETRQLSTDKMKKWLRSDYAQTKQKKEVKTNATIS